jgi:hypothetical protein
MAVKDVFNEALHTPMTRKEFLGQVGALLLAVIGVSAIMHALSTSHQSYHGMGMAATRGVQAGYGYGSMPYGGSSEGG